MATITQFAVLNPPAATGQQLDDDLSLVSAQAPIPCNASGSNTIALTQQANVYVVGAYSNNMQVSAVAASSNTGSVTAALGSLAALNVYKDTPSGPVLLVGGEIVSGCAFTLMYDAALNTGAGGWHLFTSTAVQQVKFGGNSTITNVLSGTASLSFSGIAPNTSQDQTFSVTGIPTVLPLVGDFIQIVPPSLAVAGVGYNALITSVGSLTASTSAATINIRAWNVTGSSVTVPSGVYRYLTTRSVP